ncbi:hypothetical protein HPP92_017442 [Vanilla planifolia]|uniref:Uncharacterized protein n=1 Tax=Vanilla planifolia TaxID=51239 RepID=A0A835ULY2_VANPL|nr:hypothetical protein HPP92_017442 [Vanilla planifolia]
MEERKHIKRTRKESSSCSRQKVRCKFYPIPSGRQTSRPWIKFASYFLSAAAARFLSCSLSMLPFFHLCCGQYICSSTCLDCLTAFTVTMFGVLSFNCSPKTVLKKFSRQLM